jgi:pimeloyl-ACP methyl ester carboxylesterase
VILIHGFGANADLNWREPGVHDALATDYRVIALDNRGHGLSDKPHGPEHYGQEMVDDVVRLMDHLEIQKAHIIGYSMGGFITMKMLTQHPERFLSAAPCGMGWDEPTAETRALMKEISEALERGDGFKPLLDFLEIEVEVGPFGNLMGNWIINNLNDPQALADAMRSFEELTVPRADIEVNTVPLLSLVGTKDPLKRGVEKMAGWVPHHEYHYLEGADHLSALKDPDFIQYLRAFLAAHTPAPSEAA